MAAADTMRSVGKVAASISLGAKAKRHSSELAESKPLPLRSTSAFAKVFRLSG